VAFTYLKVKFVKCLCLLPVVLVLDFVLVLRIWSSLHQYREHVDESCIADFLLYSDYIVINCNSVAN